MAGKTQLMRNVGLVRFSPICRHFPMSRVENRRFSRPAIENRAKTGARSPGPFSQVRGENRGENRRGFRACPSNARRRKPPPPFIGAVFARAGAPARVPRRHPPNEYRKTERKVL